MRDSPPSLMRGSSRRTPTKGPNPGIRSCPVTPAEAPEPVETAGVREPVRPAEAGEPGHLAEA